MDPGRGCPPQVPDRGQYVPSSHRSEVEEVGLRHKSPRELIEHTDETGMGPAEGEEMTEQEQLIKEIRERLRNTPKAGMIDSLAYATRL
jgi:hypothetical protein